MYEFIADATAAAVVVFEPVCCTAPPIISTPSIVTVFSLLATLFVPPVTTKEPEAEEAGTGSVPSLKTRPVLGVTSNPLVSEKLTTRPLADEPAVSATIFTVSPTAVAV
jgi:hypothetical protein